jgi:hypothetical protein
MPYKAQFSPTSSTIKIHLRLELGLDVDIFVGQELESAIFFSEAQKLFRQYMAYV